MSSKASCVHCHISTTLSISDLRENRGNVGEREREGVCVCGRVQGGVRGGGEGEGGKGGGGER